MNARTKQVVLCAVCLTIGVAGGWYYSNRPAGGPVEPLPPPAPTRPDAPPPPDAAQMRRLEIVGPNGTKSLVFTTDDSGVPVAQILSRGKWLTVDLAWLARKLQ